MLRQFHKLKLRQKVRQGGTSRLFTSFNYTEEKSPTRTAPCVLSTPFPHLRKNPYKLEQYASSVLFIHTSLSVTPDFMKYDLHASYPDSNRTFPEVSPLAITGLSDSCSFITASDVWIDVRTETTNVSQGQNEAVSTHNCLRWWRDYRKFSPKGINTSLVILHF